MTSGHNFTIARGIARLNIGGPAIQAILTTDVCRQKGYRTLLLTGKVPAGEGSIEYWTLDMDIVPIKIGTMSRRISWYKDLTTLWQFVRILYREKPVVLHTHTAKSGTLGRLAAAALGVYVCTSAAEGFSNVILEAMACAKSVIATSVGRNPEAVRHDQTGFLVPPGDMSAFSQWADTRLADGRLRTTMGMNGRRLAETEFSLGAMVKAHHEIYFNLFEGRIRRVT
jgi:hypothetical protein